MIIAILLVVIVPAGICIKSTHSRFGNQEWVNSRADDLLMILNYWISHGGEKWKKLPDFISSPENYMQPPGLPTNVSYVLKNGSIVSDLVFYRKGSSLYDEANNVNNFYIDAYLGELKFQYAYGKADSDPPTHLEPVHGRCNNDSINLMLFIKSLNQKICQYNITEVYLHSVENIIVNVAQNLTYHTSTIVDDESETDNAVFLTVKKKLKSFIGMLFYSPNRC